MEFTLKRNPRSYEIVIQKSIGFVILSYLGCWINPAAAPGRIALAILMVLIVANQMASVESSLPKMSYSVWLLDFMSGCLLFNISCFLIYVIVNFGMQENAKLQGLLKADKEKAAARQIEADRHNAQVAAAKAQKETPQPADTPVMPQRRSVKGGVINAEKEALVQTAGADAVQITMPTSPPPEPYVAPDRTWLERRAGLQDLDHVARVVYPVLFTIYVIAFHVAWNGYDEEL